MERKRRGPIPERGQRRMIAARVPVGTLDRLSEQSHGRTLTAVLLDALDAYLLNPSDQNLDSDRAPHEVRLPDRVGRSSS